MRDFILKEILNNDIKEELKYIGFDESYISKAQNKFLYKNIKLYNLTVAQANIIKQTALSFGADFATHKDVVTGKKEFSDGILGGSISQIQKIAEKLKFQPFKLKELGESLNDFINSRLAKSKTKLVGILNLTTNSFSDGGEYYEFDKATEHLTELINDGADVIDIGAESTKPYSEPVSAEKQLEKLLPVLKYCKENSVTTPISIDTRSSEAAQKCLDILPCMINDVSGLEYDTNMADIIAKYNAKVIIQHSKGTPDIMQDNTEYINPVDEIYLNLRNKICYALSKGIKKENIIIDVGIGFGKTREQNFELIKRIEEFKALGCPIMLGISRKSLLNMPDAENFEKDIYTLALNTLAIERNVDYLRVHNVKMHKKLLEVTDLL